MTHDTWQVTCYTWNMTPDMLHLTCDTGHLGYREYYVKIRGLLQFGKS